MSNHYPTVSQEISDKPIIGEFVQDPVAMVTYPEYPRFRFREDGVVMREYKDAVLLPLVPKRNDCYRVYDTEDKVKYFAPNVVIGKVKRTLGKYLNRKFIPKHIADGYEIGPDCKIYRVSKPEQEVKLTYARIVCVMVKTVRSNHNILFLHCLLFGNQEEIKDYQIVTNIPPHGRLVSTPSEANDHLTFYVSKRNTLICCNGFPRHAIVTNVKGDPYVRYGGALYNHKTGEKITRQQELELHKRK